MATTAGAVLWLSSIGWLVGWLTRAFFSPLPNKLQNYFRVTLFVACIHRGGVITQCSINEKKINEKTKKKEVHVQCTCSINEKKINEKTKKKEVHVQCTCSINEKKKDEKTKKKIMC